MKKLEKNEQKQFTGGRWVTQYICGSRCGYSVISTSFPGNQIFLHALLYPSHKNFTVLTIKVN